MCKMDFSAFKASYALDYDCDQSKSIAMNCRFLLSARRLRAFIIAGRMGAIQILFLVAIHATSNAQSITRNENPVRPFWVRLIASNSPIEQSDLRSQQKFPNIILSDVLQLQNGPIALLTTEQGHPTLFVGPDKTGPGRPISLQTIGSHLRLVGDKDGTLFIGGYKNYRYSGKKWNFLSDAILVKVDREGKTLWEQTYKNETQRTIQSLTSLQSGAVVVAGRENESTWVAQISEGGKVDWERYLGLGKGADVTTIGDKIFVATIDVDEEAVGKLYQEHVVVWILNGAGNIVNRHVVRKNINGDRSAAFAKLWLKKFDDAIYVFSEWIISDAAKPIEVTKLDIHGQVAWRKELRDTIVQLPNKTYLSCFPGITVLPKGDPLIACSIQDRIRVVKLDSQSGAEKQVSMMLPSCHQGSAPALFLIPKSPDTVWLFGSRPGNVSRASCTWLSQISLNQLQ